jgi:hypothetical protein
MRVVNESQPFPLACQMIDELQRCCADAVLYNDEVRIDASLEHSLANRDMDARRRV